MHYPELYANCGQAIFFERFPKMKRSNCALVEKKIKIYLPITMLIFFILKC